MSPLSPPPHDPYQTNPPRFLPPDPLPELPDKELEEISIEGVYFHGDSKEERERKLENREAVENECPPSVPDSWYDEEEGEWLETHCSDLRRRNKIKETYFQYVIWEHCYQKKEKTRPVFDKNVLFRLYDEEGNKLAEDHLRIEHEGRSFVSLLAYLPYMKSAYETRVVRIVENKEIVLGKQKFEDRAFLNAKNFYTTKDGRQCHKGGYIPDR